MHCKDIRGLIGEKKDRTVAEDLGEVLLKCLSKGEP